MEQLARLPATAQRRGESLTLLRIVLQVLGDALLEPDRQPLIGEVAKDDVGQLMAERIAPVASLLSRRRATAMPISPATGLA